MKPNALAGARSPYLRQHQTNPVAWQQWGDDAWAHARAEQKLVVVSIGYSACHWCHVMEHETFSNPEAAAFMNAHFVSIKVDREERPDVDAVYMDAVQLMTRRGGWPLNCVALPDGRPVWGGTYFPRAQWLAGLEAVREVWTEDRGRVEAYAAQLSEAVNALASPFAPSESPGARGDGAVPDSAGLAAHLDGLLAAWKRSWDPVHGGSLGSPKFPLPCQLDALLAHALPESDEAQHALRTLRAMERGGIHDQVGGGFARYSVDERWHVPHFEKMLYDNGQLLGSLAEGWAASGDPWLQRAAQRLVAWALRDLDDGQGRFRSALDADSDGAEGTYYVWRREDVARALPDAADRATFAEAFDLEGRCHWEHGQHVLQRAPITPPDGAGSPDGGGGARSTAQGPTEALDNVLQRLADWRDSPESGRARPAVDDKVLTSWNALTVAGLAKAGRVFGEPAWVARAARGATYLCHEARRQAHPEQLVRTLGSDVEGFAEDYAFAIDALLEVHQSTQDPRWRNEARALMATALERFLDARGDTVWFTSHEAEALFARSKSMEDSVLPSAGAVLANSLWRLGWACDIPAWRALAQTLTASHLRLASHLAQAARWWRVHKDLSRPYATVGVVARTRSEAAAAAATWWSQPRHGAWLEAHAEDAGGPDPQAASAGAAIHKPTWIVGKTAGVDGSPRWYVCVEGTCGLPCSTADDAWAQLVAWRT